MNQLIIDQLNVFHQESKDQNIRNFFFPIFLPEEFDVYHQHINYHFLFVQAMY